MEKAKLLENFKDLIKPLFPVGADIHSIVTNRDCFIEIDWPLKSDPNRPHKRSKTIRIIFSYEFILDYLPKTQEDKKSIDYKLTKTIKQKLLAFNPDHDSALHQPNPIEDWVIPASITG